MLCAECGKQPANLFCKNCSLRFCSKCFSSVHQFKTMASHQTACCIDTSSTATTTTTATPSIRSLCKEHNELLYLYCVTCQCPICLSCQSAVINNSTSSSSSSTSSSSSSSSNCSSSTHFGHETCSLQVATETVRKEMSRNKQAAKDLIQELEKMAANIDKKIQSTEKSAQKAQEDVKECAEKTEKLIEERMSDLVTDIEKRKAAPLVRLTQRKDKVKQALEEANHAITDAKNGLSQTDLSLLRAYKTINSHSQHLSEALTECKKLAETVSISVSFSNTEVETGFSLLGKIRPAVTSMHIVSPILVEGNTLTVEWEIEEPGDNTPTEYELEVHYVGKTGEMKTEEKEEKDEKEEKKNKAAKYKDAFTSVYKGAEKKFVVSDLCYKSTYEVRVRAKDATGWGDFSLPMTVSIGRAFQIPTRVARTVTFHNDYIRGLVCLNDGNIASASEDSYVKVWDPTTGTCVRTLSGHSGDILCLVRLSNGQIVSGGADRTIRLWDSTSTSAVKIATMTSPVKALCILPRNGGSDSSSSSSSSEDIVSSHDDRTIKVFNSSTLTEKKSFLSGHSSMIHSLCVLSDGTMVSVSDDHSIKLWNMSTYTCTRTYASAHSGTIYCVIALPTPGQFATSSEDHSVKIWSTASTSSLKSLTGASGVLYCVCALPNGMIATGSSDNTIQIWDLKTSSCVKTLSGHRGTVRALTIASAHQWLVSGGNDSACKVWTA
eukprot:TRINITY_DN310_c0_g1_i1.p1 TRINITY_DN310_c0_g1~~TRINITY_DN310_c0_g1_i1.p1  ORF type:complete len:719 (+),score=162.91 TRINITY_DN310_c0_g1_i1:58-2214(+)